jgi:hypothetical protein
MESTGLTSTTASRNFMPIRTHRRSIGSEPRSCPRPYPRYQPIIIEYPQTQDVELGSISPRSSPYNLHSHSHQALQHTPFASSSRLVTGQGLPNDRQNTDLSTRLHPEARYSASSFNIPRNIKYGVYANPIPTDDTLLPIHVPIGYPEINFKPLFLRSKVLVAVMLYNLTCLGSIVAVIRCANSKSQYFSNYHHIDLVVRYVPLVVGTLTALLYRSMMDTYARIQPYISMADQTGIREGRGSKTVALQYVRGVALNDRFTWRSQNRHSLRTVIILGSFVSTQIVGYKAALFSTVQTTEGWIVEVHAAMGWLLFSIYLLLILLYTWTLFKVAPAKTGLKWDPIRIVDQLALFHESNVLEDFQELEDNPDQSSLHLLQDKTYRLGYWEKGVDRKIWYGIGRTERGKRE